MRKFRDRCMILCIVSTIPYLMMSTQAQAMSSPERDIVVYRNGLINSAPIFENEFLALSNVFLELFIWDHIKKQTLNLVWDEIGPRVKDQASWSQVVTQIDAQVGTKIMDMVKYHLKNKVNSQIWTRFEDEVSDRVRAQFENRVGIQVRKVADRIKGQVKVSLENYFHSSSEFSEKQLSEVLPPVIHDIFLMNQVASIPMRYTQEIVEIREELSRFLIRNLSLEQAKVVLSNFKKDFFLESKDPLIHTQLELIKRNCL